jgi:hypothetical protein
MPKKYEKYFTYLATHYFGRICIMEMRNAYRKKGTFSHLITLISVYRPKKNRQHHAINYSSISTASD